MWRWEHYTEHTHAGYWLIHIALITILTRITLLSFSCSHSYGHVTSTHTHLHFAAGKHSFIHKYWCSFVLIMFFSSLKLLKLYHCSQVLDGLMCTFCKIKETPIAVTRETVQVWMPCTRKVTLLFTRVVKGIDASASKTDTYSKGLFKKTLTYNLCFHSGMRTCCPQLRCLWKCGFKTKTSSVRVIVDVSPSMLTHLKTDDAILSFPSLYYRHFCVFL